MRKKRRLMLAVLWLAVCALFVWVCSIGYNSFRYSEIKPGMTKDEVLAIVGKPDAMTDKLEWIYDAEIGPGWVEVSFDGAGRVISLNDERGYPW